MSNVDLDAAKELGLTGIKKYWRYAGQIELELDWLNDWIPAFSIFVKYSYRVDNNKEIIKCMKARQNIDFKWVSSFFVQLYESIQCWKMDGKNISNVDKLAKKHIECLIEWGISGQPR